MTVDDIVKAVGDLPTDLDALNELADEIQAAYEALLAEIGDGEPTDEQLDQIDALAGAMDTVIAAIDEAEKAAPAADEAAVEEERQARLSAAAEAFARRSKPADDEEGDTEEFAAVEDTLDESDDAGAGDAGDGSPAEDDSSQVDDTDGEEFAAADTKKETPVARFAGRVKGDQGAPTPVETPFSLDATAPNYKSGPATMLDLGKALEGMTSGRAIRSLGNGVTTSAQFAHITRNIPNRLTASDDASAMAAIESATDESKLDGGSLVAAGGWCAPSETLYDFLPTTPATGLLSLPEISIARGGIRYPVDPDFSALYDATKFHMTEAQAIAGTTKECVEIPCADMAEVRLDVLWTCITSNLLSNKGWPELTAKFIAEALKGHLHRLSAARLAAVKALSTAVTPGIPTLGTVGTVLNAVEIHAEDLRLKYRLGNATIEGIAPAWLRPILRADLAYRDRVLPEQVTDAQLDAHFSDRGVRFQYVDDYQTSVIGSGPTDLAYPTAVEVVLYPAGTFFSAVENVINLGVTYDAAGLSKNQRTELFVEDGYGVGKRAYESRALTIPVDVNGQTGLRAAVTAAGNGGGSGE